jgi:hypothetical protein
MNVYSDDDPGREYVERAKSKLGTADLESATGIGRALSLQGGAGSRTGCRSGDAFELG